MTEPLAASRSRGGGERSPRLREREAASGSTMDSELFQQVHHLYRDLRRLEALVARAAARALKRLRLVVAGQDAEDDGHARVEPRAQDAVVGGGGDEFVVV